MACSSGSCKAIGLFYVAFLIIGKCIGATIGLVYDHLFFGAVIGAWMGIGVGLLKHARIELRKRTA